MTFAAQIRQYEGGPVAVLFNGPQPALIGNLTAVHDDHLVVEKGSTRMTVQLSQVVYVRVGGDRP